MTERTVASTIAMLAQIAGLSTYECELFRLYRALTNEEFTLVYERGWKAGKPNFRVRITDIRCQTVYEGESHNGDAAIGMIPWRELTTTSR